MKYGQPFGRALAMMSAVAAIMASTAGNVVAQQAQLAKIGPYISRGKGQNKPNGRPAGAGKAAHRAAMKRRNQVRHRLACR